MVPKHPSLVIPRQLLDLVRLRQRRVILLVGTYSIPKGKLLLCTEDAADGAILVQVGNVLQGALGDMPLRVLEELQKGSMSELLAALQNVDPKINLHSKATLVEWHGIVSEQRRRVGEGDYVLSHEDVEQLLQALRPFIDKARGARSMGSALHPPGEVSINALQLARVCSAYHLIDDISRKGAKNAKDPS